jgi:hypothetical protein
VHSEGGRVRKHTTWEMMAQRSIRKGDRVRKRTQKDAGLENLLFGR